MEQLLQEKVEKLRLASAVFENTLEGIVVTNAEGTIQSVNPAFEMTTGYSPEEVIGQNPRILKSNRQDAEFYQKMWNSLLETGRWKGEIWNRRKNGEVYPEWLTISAIRNESDQTTHYVAVFSDISERKRNEEKITFQAYYDGLTGLFNRYYFYEKLANELENDIFQRKMLAILFLDLDKFKKVNDYMGHSTGDRLLQEVAQRFKQCLRYNDIIARFGGDEFTVLLSDLESELDASKVANKIHETLVPPIFLEGQEFFVSASIGISVYPCDGQDMDTLIKNADMAMYRAKELGGNGYQFYSSTMSVNTVIRLELENSLRKALERDELLLYYQPQIHVSTGEIMGAEALLRWNHPDRGFIPPDQFIPLAEETGLIIPIGEWVLRTACLQAKKWQDTGHPPIRVAVNISACQIQHMNFVNIVADILDQSGLHPNNLELEITESYLMKNSKLVTATLNELKRIGISISLDDFGTGYSSLSYLKRFPIDRLKIDRSFVQDITVDSDDAAIAKAIISMAHSLQLKVIAEGVETTEQMDFLRHCHCDEMQGYLFCKPVAKEDFNIWLFS